MLFEGFRLECVRIDHSRKALTQMDALHIALIVLVAVGIWAVVELAITLRKTRSTVDNLDKETNDLIKEVSEVTTNANESIMQLQPIIQKVDGMVTDLEPAVKKVDPLLDKTSTAIDMVTVDLASVNDILVDVSSVTDTATNVTSTVSKAANSAVSGVAGVVGKFTGGGKSRKHKLAAHSVETNEEEAEAPKKRRFPHIPGDAKRAEAADVADEADADEAPKTYFTYGSNPDGE